MTTGKSIALTRRTFVGTVMFLIFNMLSRLVKSAGSCDRRAKRSREEPPHVRGQGQKPGGPHARRAAAKRSYPTSEVWGSGREYQTAMAQERPRGATLRPRSGGAAERRCPALEVRGGNKRSYPASEVRGRDERTYPTSKVRGGDEKSYPASEVRGGGREEIPHPPSPRPGAAGGRNYPRPPTPEAKGSSREEQPHARGQGRWPGGPATRPRSRGFGGAGGPRGATPR